MQAERCKPSCLQPVALITSNTTNRRMRQKFPTHAHRLPDRERYGERRSACMKEWGRVKGVGARAGGFGSVGDRLLVGLPSVAVFPSLFSRVASVVSGQARLPRHVFALVVRMMGSLATARVGSISSATATVSEGHADRRARNLVVSEPHAAVSTGARHRISPSRRP